MSRQQFWLVVHTSPNATWVGPFDSSDTARELNRAIHGKGDIVEYTEKRAMYASVQMAPTEAEEKFGKRTVFGVGRSA